MPMLRGLAVIALLRGSSYWLGAKDRQFTKCGGEGTWYSPCLGHNGSPTARPQTTGLLLQSGLRQQCEAAVTTRWEQAAIVGVGLIGGSIGLALRRAGVARRIIGVGRSAANLQRAIGCGAIDQLVLESAGELP